MRGIVLLLLPLALLAADHKKPAAKTKPAVAAKTARPAIPPEAVEIGPDTYRYKDKDGKTWIYHRTPFGASREEEKAADAKPAPEAVQTPVRVSINGDEVRFERKSPFGTQTWTKKKTQLTDEEKAWVAHQRKDGNESADRNKTMEK